MYNPFSLQNKTILITGASSGIGRSVAVECSKMGANLIITGRNEKRLDETFEMLYSTEKTHQKLTADLTKQEEIDNLISALPLLNGIVHCAGIANHLPFQFVGEEFLKNVFNVNFFSAALLSSKIVKTKKIDKNASVVFLTSTSGVVSAYAGGSAYAASKGALSGLVKGMALDLASKKIRVNSVMPAMVQTTIMDSGDVTQEQFEEDKKRYPLKRYGKPEEVAYAVVYLLSDASAWTTGTNLLLDGGITIAY